MELARLDDFTALGIIEREFLSCDWERHFSALTGLQMDALETLQFLDRTADAGLHVADVELHDLVGITAACIRNGHRGIDTPVTRHLATTETHAAILEGGIAQTIAKRIERIVADIEIVALILEITVGSLCHRTARVEMIVIKRNLSYRLWHGDGKFAGRRLVAEEHIGNGIGSLRTTKPYVHDGIHMLLFP